MPLIMSSKTGDRSRIFRSFIVSGAPKNACHIQRSYEATASNTIVGFPVPREYIPFQAVGQFFHSQCIQSMLPSIPGNPRCSPICSSLCRSSCVGRRRYSLPNKVIIPAVNLCKHFRAVDSPRRIYSSTESAAAPYANCRIAAVHFCRGVRLVRPVQSSVSQKYGISVEKRFTIRRNKLLFIRNRRRKRAGE